MGTAWITDWLPCPRRFVSGQPVLTLDNIIYLVGGDGTADGYSRRLGTVQAYDPATDRWSPEALLTARLQVGLGVDSVNHLLYAVGGATAAPNNTALDTVEVYDPATDSWTHKQHLNTPRGAPAVAAVNGKIYAIGGERENHGAIDTVEEFDPATNTWTTKASEMPHPRNAVGCCHRGRQDLYHGWRNAEGIISTVDVYDPSLDTWTTVASLPTARDFLAPRSSIIRFMRWAAAALVARVGEQFTYQITATNNPTSYDASPLPDGLSLDHRARHHFRYSDNFYSRLCCHIHGDQWERLRFQRCQTSHSAYTPCPNLKVLSAAPA